MHKHLLSLASLALSYFSLTAQPAVFPQREINKGLYEAAARGTGFRATAEPAAQSAGSLIPVMRAIEKLNIPAIPDQLRSSQLPPVQTQALDTLIVGFVPNDTLVITGTWNHTGPIWVFGTGVLIFDNATVHDTGDVYVWGNGQILADSSSFFFPQNYFYERAMLFLQNAYGRFSNSSFHYSGLSHSLVLAENATVDWIGVHQNDWTTCGLYGAPTMNIYGCNISGEYVITDSCTINFHHADSVILWHQVPQGAVVNHSFPAGNFVTGYAFSNSTPGVSGIRYNVTADSCSTVWWALMPVNGSDVTISNSYVRLIGCWFQRGDTASVYGIFNASNYSNYIAPLSDRNLQLINTNVDTWSMYVFDSSFVSIDSCQLGEVGTQQRSQVSSQNFILDGTGGYFWATDSTFIIAANVISYNTTRSEREGLFILAYSWLPFAPPTAVHSSTIICVQNTLIADPVPYDGSVAWLSKIDGPDTASVNAVFPVTGSAWINQGPLGNAMDFGSYSLYYQLPSQSANWYPVTVNTTSEVSNGTLASWNTNGLSPGTYILKLVLKDNFGDSVEGLKVIELLPNPAGIGENVDAVQVFVYPNPSEGLVHFVFPEAGGELVIYNALGEVVRNEQIKTTQYSTDLASLPAGFYLWKYQNAVLFSSGILNKNPQRSR